jgi:hypothetical protein
VERFSGHRAYLSSMPRVEFDQLPDDARVWIFASDKPLRGHEATTLLAEVDSFLAGWKAHGAPLRSAREWRDDRFLVIGVDPTAEQASGCSIDGLFRGLRSLESSLGTTLVGGGRVFYRDTKGMPQVAARGEVAELGARGMIFEATPVFDTSLTNARSYRERFEMPARATWVSALLEPQASQASSRSATKSSSVRNG